MAQSTTALRIGTRGSPLALAQTGMVRTRLAAALGCAEAAIAVQVIKTTGDVIQDRPLAEEGGKGLFAKEIEEALLKGTIDLAVHSCKDLPAILPSGLVIAACLEREDPRDVFIGREAKSLAALPQGARVGTTSPRRIALVKKLRPDVEIVPMRGNVETRLRKLGQSEADGIILALAGLKRLGMEKVATSVMSVDEFLPAAAQGAIAIEVRADDMAIQKLLAQIDYADTSSAVAAERAFVAALQGDCDSPIAAHAEIEGEALSFRGLAATRDGAAIHDIAATGRRADATKIGETAGHELKRRLGPDFFK